MDNMSDSKLIMDMSPDELGVYLRNCDPIDVRNMADSMKATFQVAIIYGSLCSVAMRWSREPDRPDFPEDIENSWGRTANYILDIDSWSEVDTGIYFNPTPLTSHEILLASELALWFRRELILDQAETDVFYARRFINYSPFASVMLALGSLYSIPTGNGTLCSYMDLCVTRELLLRLADAVNLECAPQPLGSYFPTFDGSGLTREQLHFIYLALEADREWVHRNFDGVPDSRPPPRKCTIPIELFDRDVSGNYRCIVCQQNEFFIEPGVSIIRPDHILDHMHRYHPNHYLNSIAGPFYNWDKIDISSADSFIYEFGSYLDGYFYNQHELTYDDIKRDALLYKVSLIDDEMRTIRITGVHRRYFMFADINSCPDSVDDGYIDDWI